MSIVQWENLDDSVFSFTVIVASVSVSSSRRDDETLFRRYSLSMDGGMKEM